MSGRREPLNALEFVMAAAACSWYPSSIRECIGMAGLFKGLLFYVRNHKLVWSVAARRREGMKLVAKMDAAVESFTRTDGDGEWTRVSSWRGSRDGYSATFTHDSHSTNVYVAVAEDGDMVVSATE